MTVSINVNSSVADPDLQDPHVFGIPDPLVTGTAPAPDPSIIKQNRKKNIGFYRFVTSLCLFIFEEKCKCFSVTDPDPQPDPHPNPLVRCTDPRIRIRINGW
jgi:hypothetical protein